MIIWFTVLNLWFYNHVRGSANITGSLYVEYGLLIYEYIWQLIIEAYGEVEMNHQFIIRYLKTITQEYCFSPSFIPIVISSVDL